MHVSHGCEHTTSLAKHVGTRSSSRGTKFPCFMSSGYNKRSRSESSSEEGTHNKRTRTQDIQPNKKRTLEDKSEPTNKKQKMRQSLGSSGSRSNQPKKLNISLKGKRLVYSLISQHDQLSLKTMKETPGQPYEWLYRQYKLRKQ
jgi:hypothetical protein